MPRGRPPSKVKCAGCGAEVIGANNIKLHSANCNALQRLYNARSRHSDLADETIRQMEEVTARQPVEPVVATPRNRQAKRQKKLPTPNRIHYVMKL